MAFHPYDGPDYWELSLPEAVSEAQNCLQWHNTLVLVDAESDDDFDNDVHLCYDFRLLY